MNENTKLSEKAVSIIDKKDIQMLRTIEDKFETLMLGHSEYQMKNFIIGQFITPDRKHRQCLHELWSRYGALVSTWYETEKLKLEIRNLQFKKNEYEYEDGIALVAKEIPLTKKKILELDKIDLDLTHAKLRLSLSAHGLKETVREMRCFFGMMEKLQPGRKHDNYEDGEAEFWEIKMKMQKTKI
jgi:hypothetical protein